MDDFVDDWEGKGSEQAYYQIFWIDFIQKYCGIDKPTKFLKFQVPVEFENSKRFIDVWIPSTKTLIEQKSRGKSFDKTGKQSDKTIVELPERFGELDFLVDEKQSEIKTAEYVSASAGSLIGSRKSILEIVVER